MKKSILVFALIASVFVANAQKNVFKANPLGLVFGIANLSYERVVSGKGAFEVGLSYAGSKISFGDETIKANAVGGEGKYKFYFSSSKEAPRGWYGAPFVSYSVASAEATSGEDVSFSAFSGGGLAGYQWVFGRGGSGFALDLNFGVQYISVSAAAGSSVNIDGVLPRLGLSLGYAW